MVNEAYLVRKPSIVDELIYIIFCIFTLGSIYLMRVIITKAIVMSFQKEKPAK